MDVAWIATCDNLFRGPKFSRFGDFWTILCRKEPDSQIAYKSKAFSLDELFKKTIVSDRETERVQEQKHQTDQKRSKKIQKT